MIIYMNECEYDDINIIFMFDLFLNFVVFIAAHVHPSISYLL